MIDLRKKQTFIVAALLTCGFHALPSSAQSGPSDRASAGVAAGNAALARKDYTAAAGHFARACDAGSVEACGALGEMYSTGQGVTANGKIAAPMLAKACDAGIAKACGALGGLYDRGNGVTANKALAFKLYDVACSRSVMASCHRLGNLYESGEGAGQDFARAAALYQGACTAGVADGCSSIGSMYAQGRHFRRDETQADSFFKLGCSRGSTTGCKLSESLAAERDSRRRRALQEAEERRAIVQSYGNSVAKDPKDCFKSIYATPPRSTYTECENGECKTYYQNSVGQHADDGLFGFFNPVKRTNICNRSITVFITYSKEPVWNFDNKTTYIMEDEHKTLAPGERYITKYTSPIVQRVIWAN